MDSIDMCEEKMKAEIKEDMINVRRRMHAREYNRLKDRFAYWSVAGDDFHSKSLLKQMKDTLDKYNNYGDGHKDEFATLQLNRYAEYQLNTIEGVYRQIIVLSNGLETGKPRFHVSEIYLMNKLAKKMIAAEDWMDLHSLGLILYTIVDSYDCHASKITNSVIIRN